jgi:hypothetical protein
VREPGGAPTAAEVTIAALSASKAARDRQPLSDRESLVDEIDIPTPKPLGNDDRYY